MPKGTCRLCLAKDVELCDSHFVPAGFYKIAFDETQDIPHPVVISPGASVLSSAQATDYLLCADCEDRFNKNGEGWILKHCWKDETYFPIFDILRAAGPSPTSEPKFLVYDVTKIPAIDLDTLVYFGASIFWRAAMHQWRLLRPNPTKLELGPLEEKLRAYLMGGPFPRNPVMIIVVNSGKERMRNMMMQFPFLATKERKFNQYRFTVPGFTFQMFTGYDIPDDLRALCSVRSRQIYQAPDADYVNMKNSLAMVQKAPRKGSLAKKG